MSTQDHTTSVEYREIARFVGYRFGSDGSYWSQWAYIGLTPTWWQRSGCLDRHGYRIVQPRDSVTGKYRLYRLHHLILEAFVGPRPDGMECRHKNNNPSDNRIENLAWGTHRENMADKKAHGTSQVGILAPAAKLTERQVYDIRSDYLAGISMSELARQHKVCLANIQYIIKRKTWKHLV